MDQRKRTIRRLMEWTALFAAAGVTALAGLWALGRLQIDTALLAGLGVIVISTGAASIVLRRVERVRRLVENFDPVVSVPSELRHGSIGQIAGAAIRTRQTLTGKIEDAERELAAANLVVDHLPVPIAIVDAKGQIANANRAARETLGNNIAGRVLSSVIRDPSVLDAVGRIQAGADRAEAEMSVAGPPTRHFQAHILPVEQGRDSAPGAIIALLDLTAAKSIDKTRTDFVANVSHELRTPLTALIGFIETLRGPASDDAEARARFLTIMQEQSERMLRLISDLMSLTRIEMNEHARPTVRANVVTIVQSVAELMQIRAAEKRIKIRLKVPQKPALVLGDADELTQVFQNLIENAIKYGRPGSTVTVEVRTSTVSGKTGAEQRVMIAVVDEGEGISSEHLPRLTERFYRVDADRSRVMGGTGLGLAIVKHIASRHNGALSIKSSPGEGSTFTISIPSADSGG